MQACGRLVAGMGEQDVDRDILAGIKIDGANFAFVVGNLHDPAIDDRDLAARQIGLDFGRNVVTIGEDSQLVGPMAEQLDRLVRLRAGPDDDAVEMAFEVGPLSRALADQPDDIRARASAAVRAAFAGRPGERSVMIDGAAWIIMARNPAS